MITGKEHSVIKKGYSDSIDQDKLVRVIKKSVPVSLALISIALFSSYLFLRWTKPMYESSSEIKLEVKSDAIEFGFGGFMDNKNLSVMSGEIELIKSKLFFSKLIDSIKLDISYYTVGNFLDDEKYPSSPLKFTYNLKNDQWIDRRIYIELEKGNTYKISFDDDFKNFTSHSLGEKVQTE
ncbi:MAG: tyrosine protein kinase, partial [Cyclobacteriaceae bacterium]|nr:tyrosine protein kinase [Cyclobacteriaceae bacterium]